MTANKKVSLGIVIAAIVVFLVVFFMNCFTVIEEGFIGVKYQFGKIVDDSLSAGLNFKIPFIQSVDTIDIREQMYETNTNAYTKDTQTVENMQVKLNYMYDQSTLSLIIRNIGIKNVENKLIIPQLQSIMKNEIGQFRAEELVQNRSNIQENIEEKLRSSLASSGILVISFAIENIDFEDSFEEAIRAKVTAEQQALQMQNLTAAKEEEARQVVIAAQAEADSAKLAADAEAYAIETIQKQIAESPEYLAFLKVQKWNGAFPQVMSEGVNPFVTLN